MWEYRHELADSNTHALLVMHRLDRDGWRVFSCSPTHFGGVSIYERRPRTSESALPSTGAFSVRDRSVIDLD